MGVAARAREIGWIIQGVETMVKQMGKVVEEAHSRGTGINDAEKAKMGAGGEGRGRG
jgi:hypothetical protein